MNHFSIETAFNHGWELFKKNTKLLVLASIVYLFSLGLQNIDFLYPTYSLQSRVFVLLVSFVLATAIQIGWYKILLKLIEDKDVKLKEMFDHGSLVLKYFCTFILFVLIVSLPAILGSLVGSFLLDVNAIAFGIVIFLAVLETIILALKFQFAPILVIDSQIGIINAFKKSEEMTRGVKGRLFILFIVMGIANFLGALFFGVGMIVSTPVSTLAYLQVYRKLHSENA